MGFQVSVTRFLKKGCGVFLFGLGVLIPSVTAQQAYLIFEEDFESYASGAYNQSLQAPAGKWWMVQNSATQNGCNNNITPDQHKIITTNVWAGQQSCRIYYNTMEQWYEAATGYCKWRAELAQRMNNGLLPGSGPTEVWYGFAIRPGLTDGLPWVKRGMGATGTDVNSTGLRDGLQTHICQFVADETGSKNVLVDIHAAMDGTNRWNISYIGDIPTAQCPIKWEQWNTMVLNVKTGAGGWVNVWINGIAFSFSGNLHEATWVYDFKFGIYGDRVNNYATASFDNIKIARGHDGGFDLVNPVPAATMIGARHGTRRAAATVTGVNSRLTQSVYAVNGTLVGVFDELQYGTLTSRNAKSGIYLVRTQDHGTVLVRPVILTR